MVFDLQAALGEKAKYITSEEIKLICDTSSLVVMDGIAVVDEEKAKKLHDPHITLALHHSYILSNLRKNQRPPEAYFPILMSSTPLGGWIRASSYWHFHWISRLICPFSTPSTVSPS